MKPAPICPHCEEPIMPGEPVAPTEGTKMHWECGLRAVSGGANHLLKQCTCCGGILPPDPAFLTRRQAARVAAAIFKVMKEPAP